MSKESPSELSEAFSKLVRARAATGRPLQPKPGGYDRDQVKTFERRTGLYLPAEYLDFLSLYANSQNILEPFFWGDPVVPFEIAFGDFDEANSAFGSIDNYPYLSFCESDGDGLFVELTDTKAYEAPLFYIAHGVEPRLRFRSIRLLLLGITRCLENGLSDVVHKPAYGGAREAQERILEQE